MLKPVWAVHDDTFKNMGEIKLMQSSQSNRNLTATWLAQLVERQSTVQKVEGQGLKITEQNVLPL